MAMTMMAAAMWQETYSNGDLHKIMIFTGIAAFSLLVLALGVVGSGIFAMKAKKDAMIEIAALKAKVMPLIERSHTLVTELTPKINDISAKAAIISANVEDISALVRDKLEEFGPTLSAANETLRDANQTARVANAKAQEQVMRVNGMVSSVLDATAEAGKAVQRGINVPVREFAGIMGGLKAGVQVFMRGARPKPPVYRAPIGTYQGSVAKVPMTVLEGPGIKSD